MPTLRSATPYIVCLEKIDRANALNGKILLRIGDSKVEQHIETAESVSKELEAYTKVIHHGVDTEFCKSSTAMLTRESIEPGYLSFTLFEPRDRVVSER